MVYNISICKYLRLTFSNINPFPNKPWFSRVCSKSLLKTLWEKGEIARHEQFLLFLHVWRTFFYMFGELYAVFIKFDIVVCKLYQFGKFVLWERVNDSLKAFSGSIRTRTLRTFLIFPPS